MKTIFLNAGRVDEIKPRPGAQANNDDDPAGGATPAALALPSATDGQIIAPAEQPHRPWLMQGMRNAL